MRKLTLLVAMVTAALVLSAPAAQADQILVKDPVTGEPCSEVTFYDAEGEPSGGAGLGTSTVEARGGCEVGAMEGTETMFLGNLECEIQEVGSVHFDSNGAFYMDGIDFDNYPADFCGANTICRVDGDWRSHVWFGQLNSNGDGDAYLAGCFGQNPTYYTPFDIHVDVTTSSVSFEQFHGPNWQSWFPETLNWTTGVSGQGLDIEIVQ